MSAISGSLAYQDHIQQISGSNFLYARCKSTIGNTEKINTVCLAPLKTLKKLSAQMHTREDNISMSRTIELEVKCGAARQKHHAGRMGSLIH